MQRNIAAYKRMDGQMCGDNLELPKAELIAECPDFYLECYVAHKILCYQRILRYLDMGHCMSSTLGQYFTWQWN